MRIAKQYLVWLQFKSDLGESNSDAISEIESMIATTTPSCIEDLAAKVLVALDGVDMSHLTEGTLAGSLLRDAAQILEDHPLFKSNECISRNHPAKSNLPQRLW